MFVQTEITPNPNSLKFLPGKIVSNDTPIEITDKTKTNNELIRNILSINGVTGIFLSGDFLSVNQEIQYHYNRWNRAINNRPLTSFGVLQSGEHQVVMDAKSEET